MPADEPRATTTASQLALDLAALLQPVVDDALGLPNIDGAAIFVRPPDTSDARLACSAGIEDGALLDRIHATHLPAGDGQSGVRALRSALVAGGWPTPHIVAAPIEASGSTMRGVLCLLLRSAPRRTSRDRALPRLLARRAALAIEHAELLDHLRDVEARHRFVLDRLPDGVWAAGADRTFTYLSAGIERLVGYRREELLGRSSEILMHESSWQAFEDGYRWQIAHPDGDQTYRVNLRHKDGHAVPVELHNIGTPVDGRYGGGTGSVREIGERLRLERELREQAAELAASRERAHLAQELHDSVTQALFSLTVTAGAARMLTERGQPGVEAKLDEIAALARDALAEMRSLIYELRPGSLAEDGFAVALRKHVGAVEGRTGLVIRLDLGAGLERLELPVEDALYRIAQEAIHNVVKHAQASNVRVRVTSSSTAVRMDIRDDGVGFDQQRRTDGLGLVGMAARAERVGGSVTIVSAPGRGTIVSVSVPGAARTAPGSDTVDLVPGAAVPQA